MTQDEFSQHLAVWLDAPHKTIKQVAAYAGYDKQYVWMIKKGTKKASPRLIGELLQAMQMIDAKAPPKTERDHSKRPPTLRNLARVAGLKRYHGRPCPHCGGTERYVSGVQCAACVCSKRWRP